MKEFFNKMLQYVSSIILSFVFSTITLSNFDTNKLPLIQLIGFSFFTAISAIWICDKINKR